MGSFILSGKIRTVAYPDIHPEEFNSDGFNHTYCARADVYQDIDNSGKQTPIAHVSREYVVTFTTGNNYEYLVDMEADPSSSESNYSKAAIINNIGSVIGILIVIPIIAFFLMKKHKGVMKIHDSTNTDNDADDAIVKDGDIEIV